MARIRTIKPEFWHDKRVASWPVFTRLLFIGLWSAADDHGRGSAEPARIAAELFPYDLSRDPRETLAKVSEGLETLSADDRIVVYEVDEETYFEVTNWEKHQRVDKPGKSKIPSVSDAFARPSRESRETPEEKRRLEQGTGNREEGKKEGPAAANAEVGNGLADLDWQMADGSVQQLTDDDVQALQVMHPNQDLDFAVRQAWGHHRGLPQHERPRSLVACVNGWLANSRSTPQGRKNLRPIHEPPKASAGIPGCTLTEEDNRKIDALVAKIQPGRSRSR